MKSLTQRRRRRRREKPSREVACVSVWMECVRISHFQQWEPLDLQPCFKLEPTGWLTETCKSGSILPVLLPFVQPELVLPSLPSQGLELGSEMNLRAGSLLFAGLPSNTHCLPEPSDQADACPCLVHLPGPNLPLLFLSDLLLYTLGLNPLLESPRDAVTTPGNECGSRYCLHTQWCLPHPPALTSCLVSG